MCYSYSDPISLLRWWCVFSLQLHTSLFTNAAQTAKGSLAQMHAQRPKDKWRSPLLSLHVSTLKPTLKPLSSEPRRDVWLVKSES